MNRSAVIAIGLLLASPFGFLALDAFGITGDFQAEAPTWHAGEKWTYDMVAEGRASGAIAGMVSGASETFRMYGTHTTEVLNTTLDLDGNGRYLAIESVDIQRATYGDDVVYDEQTCRDDPDAEESGAVMTCDAPSEPEDVEGACLETCSDGAFLSLYDRSDIALILDPSEYAQLFGSIGSDDTGSHGSAGEIGEALGDLALRRAAFPLDKGDSWTMLNFTEDDIQLEIRAEAVEEEYIRLDGLGPAESIRIEARLTDESRKNFHDAIKQRSEEESDGQVSIDMDIDIRWVGWYAPKYGNIVKEVTSTSIAGRANGQGLSGSFSAEAELASTLTGYSDRLLPERSVEEAAALVTFVDDSAEPAVALSTQTIALTAVADGVDHVIETMGADAGDEDALPVVTLGAKTGRAHDDVGSADGSIPSEATLRWSHISPTTLDGVRTPLDGDAPTVRLHEPGIHVFLVRAFDSDGALMGSDTVTVAVDERVDMRQTSNGDDTVAVIGDMTSANSLVTPGAVRALIDLKETLYADERFVVTDPDGEEAFSIQHRTVAADDVSRHEVPLRPGLWTFEEEIRLGAGEPGAVVTIDYERSAFVPQNAAAVNGNTPRSPSEPGDEPMNPAFGLMGLMGLRGPVTAMEAGPEPDGSSGVLELILPRGTL